jgi:NAD(P)-dependent dehydrogenase (short-subunit alcohol dehydrogenase family)
MKQSVQGRHIAITGGARGIGLATARALVAAGAKVSIGDLDGDLTQASATELGAYGGPLDVTSRASFARFLEEAQAVNGVLYGLVNNAGIMPLGPFLEESDETAAAVVDVDLHGVILGSKLALEIFCREGAGHLVNVASMAGRHAIPHTVTYSAAKHAVVGLTEGLRREFRSTGIGFSYVLPAPVHTELGAGVGKIRGLAASEPEAVAAAVVRALRTGRVDVWVPRRGKALVMSGLVSPRALTDWLAERMGSNEANVIDPKLRVAHDRRAVPGAAVRGDREQQ